jgi:diguanylate cyclase (GGDEF)-like protein
LFVWRLEDPEDDLSVVAVSANPAAIAMSLPNADSPVGRRVLDLWPLEQAPMFSAMLADAIRRRRSLFLPEVRFDLADATRWLSVRVFPLPDDTVGMLSEDVTDQHLAKQALRHQALHDSLTGLPNRALLRDRLVAALATAQRTGLPLALLVLDLDQFKEINDTLGHHMGDRMLQQVAARLSEVLRDCDSVARLGGDEFAVLLTVDASRTGAENVARRISAGLAEPFDLDGLSVQTAASIGIALSPEHGSEPEQLVQRADIAMYSAKRASRPFAFYAAEDDRTSVRRLSLVGELRQAIERDELVLHYQPQIDVATGAVVGAEALVRWQHPEHGLLPPAEFIALAEVSGIIQPLTRWVIRNATMQGTALLEAGHRVVMAVNVSARNLYEPDLVGSIEADLTHSGLPPELLMLELTESELVDDPSQVIAVLSEVSRRGVRIAVDDFGTGWSSLSNLTQLPIDQIKIDRSFVSRMLAGGDDAVIVRSIVDLGHNLGLEVVAEGVEGTATLNALGDLGCDQAQGYLIARPMPAEELMAWLDRAAVAAISSL